jgi:peptide/nickel transport system substrate-binding protein
VWLIDQWRQVGLTVKQEVAETSKYFADIRGGNFEVAVDFQCGYIVEPDLDLYKFQSKEISQANYGGYTDKTLDELYQRQSRSQDPEERKRLIREFEKRMLDDEAHYLTTLQWHRIIVHNAKVRGWTVTPSHYLNQQLDTVWLAE